MKVLKLCILLVLCSVQSHQNPSENDEEFTATEADVEIIPTDLDDSKAGEYNHQVTISYGCPVNPSRPCVPKCCDLDQIHANVLENPKSPQCVSKLVDFWVDFADRPYDVRNESLDVKDRYEYFIGDPCATGKYILDPKLDKRDKFSLFSNGTILIDGKFYPMSDFCVDEVDGAIRAFVCFEVSSAEVFEFYNILYPVCEYLSHES